MKRPINIDAGDRIEIIKSFLQEKEGIPVKQIRLIFGGKQLVDTQLISETSIVAGSVIHMVIQLRGG